MKNMKALGYTKAHTLNDYSIVEYNLPKPLLRTNDLLVEVKAISVNPVDTKIRKSRNAVDEKTPVVLGWDASGIVVEVGAEVSNFKIGDEVYYSGELNRAGSNAELQAIDQRLVALKPKTLSFAEAAAIPLTAVTAWEALLENKNIDFNSPCRILIIGGAGGVGSMAIQILKAKTKAVVIATASRKESIEWCKNLGADYVINHANNLADELKKINIDQVDAVFGTTHSAEYVPKLAEIIRPFGTFVLIDDPGELNIAHFKQKSIKTSWEFMFSKSLFNFHPEEQGQALAELAELIEAGKINSTLRQTYHGLTPQNLKLAHETLESSKSFGKIVITIK
jgi:zinc-binding alcohol dehydrogenase family protein